ncbi:MAG: hypothetical protein OEZ34_16245 [Spirochaetia bacterium]|nr:hypothetical protein [Spirochaetia bacterium]
MKSEEQIREKLEEYEKKIEDSKKSGGSDDSTEFIANSLYLMIYLERMRILRWILDIDDDDKLSDSLKSHKI